MSELTTESVGYFVGMSKSNHGEVLRKAIEASDLSLSQVARRMKMSRSTLYSRFDKTELDYYELARFGKVLQYDFSKEIPELTIYSNHINAVSVMEDPETNYEDTEFNLKNCRKSLEHYRAEAYRLSKELSDWKDKYIQAQEELNRMKLKYGNN